MTRYERITIKGAQRKRNRTGWYEVLSESNAFLLLRPLDSYGEDHSFYNADSVLVDKQELVSTDLVVKRQLARMNNHYGTLELVT